MLDETTGAAIAEWVTGGKPVDHALELLRKAAFEAAAAGTHAFTKWWNSAAIKPRRKALRPDIDNLASIARAADDEIARKRQAEARMTAPARARQAAAQSLQRAGSPTCSGHEAFIRSLPCLACGKPAPSECAHVRQDTHLGIGLALKEPYIVPLCGPATIWNDCCHSRLH